jgi:hypothetical protein
LDLLGADVWVYLPALSEEAKANAVDWAEMQSTFARLFEAVRTLVLTTSMDGGRQ